MTIEPDKRLLSYGAPAKIRKLADLEDDVLACFWWEYGRTSIEVVRAVENAQAGKGDYMKMKAARILTPEKIARLAEFNVLYGRQCFPEMSWFEAESFTATYEGHNLWPVGEIWSAELEQDTPAFQADELPISLKSGKPKQATRNQAQFPRNFGDEDDKSLSLKTSFVGTINWLFSEEQILGDFRVHLQSLRPATVEKQRRAIVASPSSVELQVQPKKALGWLYILRGKALCSSWEEFLDRFGKEIHEASNTIPDVHELIARKKKAEKVLGWFKTGQFSSVR